MYLFHSLLSKKQLALKNVRVFLTRSFQVVIQPDTVYEHFQYQFEGEAYDTIPDLVRSYVSSSKPVSLASGARIRTPSNRSAPLLVYPTGITRTITNTPSTNNPSWKPINYGASGPNVPPKPNSSLSSPNVSFPFETQPQMSSFVPIQVANYTATETPLNNCPCCPLDESQTANHTANELSWNLPSGSTIYPNPNMRIFGEQAALLDNTYNTFAAQRNAAENNFNFTNQRSMPLSPAEIMQMSSQQGCSAEGVTRRNQNTVSNSITDDSKLELWENMALANPPAKPARTPAPAYQASGSDSGNGSGDSAQSSALSDPPFTFDIPRSSLGYLDVAYAEDLLTKLKILDFRQLSKYDMGAYVSELLSSRDNKPLDSDALQTIKLLLRTSGPLVLATHLTKVDLDLFMSPHCSSDSSNPLKRVSGLELCLLAHGDQIRMDIIER